MPQPHLGLDGEQEVALLRAREASVTTKPARKPLAQLVTERGIVAGTRYRVLCPVPALLQPRQGFLEHTGVRLY
jgi:hypothetical protein